MGKRQWTFEIVQTASSGNKPYKDNVTHYRVTASYSHDFIKGELRTLPHELTDAELHKITELAYGRVLRPAPSQMAHIKQIDRVAYGGQTYWEVTVTEPFND